MYPLHGFGKEEDGRAGSVENPAALVSRRKIRGIIVVVLRSLFFVHRRLGKRFRDFLNVHGGISSSSPTSSGSAPSSSEPAISTSVRSSSASRSGRVLVPIGIGALGHGQYKPVLLRVSPNPLHCILESRAISDEMSCFPTMETSSRFG